MKVDRVFKGKLPGEVELFDDGMCDGPDLRIGRQYLMYTANLGDVLPSRGCTRSRSIETAGEDLKFLNEYVKGKTVTQISGTVRLRPDEPEDSRLGEEGRRPMKDVRIVLSGPRKRYTLTTDASGRYSISGIPPGDYSIESQFDGYGTDWSPDEIKLGAHACAVADVLMKIDRRVQGTIRTELGEPAPGVRVDLVPVHPARFQQTFLGVSDDEGRYEIDGVAPGEYYLGINIKRSPTKDRPYAPTYYPNTPDIRQAIPITFTPGASVRSYDLTAPAKLALITIRGRIVDPAGNPPAGRVEVRLKTPDFAGQIEDQPIRVDSSGRFEYQLCEGVRYGAFAFAGTAAKEVYAGPLEFVPKRENPELMLVLNKSATEFQKELRSIRKQQEN